MSKREMVNLNLWVSMTEKEYAALMNTYQDEYAFKFQLSRIIDRFIKSQTEEYTMEHITFDPEGESA